MSFERFIGINLGGGKGKTTAVAELRRSANGVEVVGYGISAGAPRSIPQPFYDERLVAYLLQQPPNTFVAIDAPLTLPACVRCQLPTCPTAAQCEVQPVAWFRARENGSADRVDVGGLCPPESSREVRNPSRVPRDDRRPKPKYTAYTQRVCDVLLVEDQQIQSRETLGQGMGPITSRAAYLRRALTTRYTLNRDLIEVDPKATLTMLFSPRTARQYRKSGRAQGTRLEILNALTDLNFAPGAWREDALHGDHKFDAILCAYTAYLASTGKCTAPPAPWFEEEGWVWLPMRSAHSQ